MAKGQKKTNREVRKPKKEGPAKTSAANPSTKGTPVSSAKGKRGLSKIEDYEAKAAASLAALELATTEADRAHHRRAYSVWRKLIAGIGEAAERAAMKPAPAPKPLNIRPGATESRWGNSFKTDR